MSSSFNIVIKLIGDKVKLQIDSNENDSQLNLKFAPEKAKEVGEALIKLANEIK